MSNQGDSKSSQGSSESLKTGFIKGKIEIVKKEIPVCSFEELHDAIDKGKKFIAHVGEDFGSEIMWSRKGIITYKKNFFIEENDEYEDYGNEGGPEMITGPSLDKYRWSDGNGIFRRRCGHEHLIRICTLESEQRLITKMKGNKYKIAGIVFTQEQLLECLKITVE